MKAFAAVIGAVVLAFVLFTGLNYASVAGKAVNAPAAVMNRTLDTDNIMNSYEEFRDVNTQYQARVEQIAEYKENAKHPVDNQDAEMLRTELSATKQSCRELVARYNAQSSKLNHALFKGNGLPQFLDLASCN